MDEGVLHGTQLLSAPTARPGGLPVSAGTRCAREWCGKPHLPVTRCVGRSRVLRPHAEGGLVKLRLPSPAMVVAVVALIVALSGTLIAAVDYAHDADAIDGMSAVGASAT